MPLTHVDSVTLDAKGTPVHFRITVPASPAAAVLVVAANPKRVTVLMVNNTDTDVYLSNDPAMTTAGAYTLLPARSVFTDEATGAAWYALAPSAGAALSGNEVTL